MQLYYAAEPRGYPKKYVGNEGSRDMDKIILDGKMRELSIILQEGDTRDCIKTICDLLYGRNEQEDSENIEMGRIWEQKIEATIANSMKNSYQKSANGKVIVPHYSAWRTEKYRFLFTHLDEIEEEYIQIPEKIEKAEDIQIDEEQRKKQEKERVQRQYMKAIDNDFGRYYQNIYETIVKSPLFFEADITYILLQELLFKKGETVEYNIDEELDVWKQGYQFLTIPEIVMKDRYKWYERSYEFMNKQLENRGVFPYQYRIEYDNKNSQFFRIAKANFEFQIALMYYRQFRTLCRENRKGVRCNFKNLDEIIKNVCDIMEVEDTADTEKIIFPYMIEKILDVNLRNEFARYYHSIPNLEAKNKNVKNIRNQLERIFKVFCMMPNVFSRVYILKELLEPVMFLEQDRYRQLVIIENKAKKMEAMYSEYVKAILSVFERIQKNNEYLERIQKSYIALERNKRPVFKEEYPYLFVEVELNDKENERSLK